MTDRPAVLNCKALSLLRTVNVQKSKMLIFSMVLIFALILTTVDISFICWIDDKKSHLKRVLRAWELQISDFWATICKTVCTMLSARCLSVCPVLSVMFVHGCQTVGQIKTKLGMQVGLGPGHIVLDGDPAPPPPKGHSPQFSAHICCGQMAAWIKNQDVTWYGARPRPRRLCVRLGPRSTSPKGGKASKFSAHVYWYSYAASGILHYCGQMAVWMKTPLGMEVQTYAQTTWY